MSGIPRVSIDVDKHELAAILNWHSAQLAGVGTEFLHSYGSLDSDDVEWAAHTATRMHELMRATQDLVAAEAKTKGKSVG